MAIEARDAFKLGFLHRLAEAGLSGQEIGACVKTASCLLKQAFNIASVLGPVTRFGVNAATVLGLAAPVAAGVGGGYLLNKAVEKPVDEDDVKETELTDEYKRLARVAKLNARLKLLRRRIGQ